MTIEQLEALEKAATAGPFAHDVDRRHGGADQIVELSSGRHLTIVFGTSNGNENDLPLLAEARNAMPHLLAVAKAAKLVKAANARRANAQVQDCCVRVDYEQSMGYACDQLTLALERLEAQ